MKIKTNNAFKKFQLGFKSDHNGIEKQDIFVSYLGLIYSVDEFIPISDEMKEAFPCLKGWSYIRTVDNDLKPRFYFEKKLVVQTRNDFTEYKIGSIDYE